MGTSLQGFVTVEPAHGTRDGAYLGLIDILRLTRNGRCIAGVNSGGNTMAWSKPIIREIECGMEINMYGPDGDRENEDGDLF